MIRYEDIYNQKALEKDKEANLGRAYQQCSLSVLDTISDPNIEFDSEGICQYYHDYKIAEKEGVFLGEEGEKKLQANFDKIKSEGKNKKYDSILGLSGGVDSTFLCYLAKEQGLNPLIVHFDNGWNSELAQHNIESTVKKCGFELYTYVVNWQHFRELQLSYLKASVVDIEVLTDQGFMAVLYSLARKYKIKYVLAGMNIVTEHVLPRHWIYSKRDIINIKSIQNTFGNQTFKSLDTYPVLSYANEKYCKHVLKMEVVSPLNYIEYEYDNIKDLIKRELDWRDYGGKHYESIWTRFYQGYILPKKFNIDKRKAHLSNLIFSGQITKEQALQILSNSTYPDMKLLEEDLEYVSKKFNLSTQEFEKLMNEPRREHREFEYDKGFWGKYPFLKFLKP